MNKHFLRLMVVVAFAMTLSACGNMSPHCTPQLGVSGDIDVGPVGVSGGLGVHSTQGTCVPQGGQQARRPPPGALTKAVLNSPDVKWLTNFTTADGEGMETRHSRVETGESDRGAGFDINAVVTGDAVLINRRVVPP